MWENFSKKGGFVLGAWSVLAGLLLQSGTSWAVESKKLDWKSSAVAPHIQVELVSQKDSIEPGKKFWLGFYFTLEKGWHIYWKNPGDSGSPTRATWSLPPAFTAGPIVWPAPTRIDLPPLTNYGYENHVLLPVEVMADPALATEDDAKTLLQVQLKWLVCHETCIPGHAQLTLELPIAKQGAAELEPQWTDTFEKAFKSIPLPLPPTAKVEGLLDSTHFDFKILGVDTDEKTEFFPDEPNQVQASAPQELKKIDGVTHLILKRSDQLMTALTHTSGVLTTASHQSFAIDVPLGQATVISPTQSASIEVASTEPSGFFKILEVSLFAFLGGLILNLMPCVFPVLSMKVFSFVKMKREDRSWVRMHALAYTLGILVSFWSLVAVLLIIRSTGEQLGWGFQLQSPRFIAILAGFLFLFGLNLLSVFEMGTSLLGLGQSLADKKGHTGSFFTGVLATVVATPCTAPFMGSAVGFALSEPAIVCFVIFTFLALGLACPYVLLAFIPQGARLLPRPGVWMETFKQVMGFFILATVLWLVWVFGLQTDSEQVTLLLVGFLGVGLASWMIGRWPRKRSVNIFGIILIILSVFGVSWLTHDKPKLEKGALGSNGVPNEAGLNWEVFSPEKVAQYQQQKRPMFVDFTAAWCVSCHVNELITFRSTEVKALLKEYNLALLKADWTSEDPIITQTLASFGRSGVPLYVIYGKDGSTTVLPEVINATLVINELKKLKERNSL